MSKVTQAGVIDNKDGLVISPYLIPGNVKKDVVILGVKGEYEGAVDTYTGPYTVTPSTSSQVLNTINKKCEDYITVEAIEACDGSTLLGDITDADQGGTQYAVNISSAAQKKHIRASVNKSGYYANGTRADLEIVVGVSDTDVNKIIPGNIKKGVTILGVTGTLDGGGGGGGDGDATFIATAPTSGTLSMWIDTISTKNIDTANVTSMAALFAGLSNLTSIDFTNFSTAACTSMQSMFMGCMGLTSLDLSTFNPSKVTDMSSMFLSCTNLASIVWPETFDASLATMSKMFMGCAALTALDLSSFKTTNCSDMSYMFSNCTGLKTINLSGFTTPKVMTFAGMFSGCTALTELDLSTFSTTQATNLDMFVNNDALITLTIPANWGDNAGLASLSLLGAPNLSAISIQSFLNCLADRASAGKDNALLYLTADQKTKATDTYINAAKTKGWSVI